MHYKPALNQVLLELDTTEDKWGTGNDDSMLGRSYNKGTVVELGIFFATADYPMLGRTASEMMKDFLGKEVMYNEGTEAGKTFEDGDKLYALVDYWQIVGYREDA